MRLCLSFYIPEIADTRIQQELQTLQSRGNSHKAILEKQFDYEMIDHVVLMESQSNTDVVITNEYGTILDSSASIHEFKKYIIAPLTPIPNHGMVVEENWHLEPYIATISPIVIDQRVSGYVYMFQDTESVHSLIHSFNEHFICIAGWISLVLYDCYYYFPFKGYYKATD